MSVWIDTTTLLIVFLIFVPLEHLFPLHHEQKRLRSQLLTDLIYLVFNGILIKIGLVFTIGLSLLLIRTLWPDGIMPGIKEWPVWLQAILATIIADIGFYLAHRAFHSVPFLWRFHAVHHSIEELDCIATHRVHPVDQILTKTASLVPLFALGFSAAGIAAYALIYQLQSLLVHSNLKVEFGPLRWLLASPHFHHWHHANQQEAYDKNFAGQIPLLDWLGGTLFMPDRMPTRYGTDAPVPDAYHRQLLYPFTPESAAGEAPPPADATDAPRPSSA